MEPYISNNPPGICSQEDFDHDFQLMINQMREHALSKHTPIPYLLIQLAIDKGYKLNWPEN